MAGLPLISAFGLVVIFCEISVIVSADFVPALIFGGQSTDSVSSVDALQKISETEFNEILLNKVGGSRAPIVVFRKENLCVEELSKQKLKLNNLNLVYLPSVDSPLSTLENLESYNISKNEKPESISDGQMIVVEFTDFNAITEIFKTLKSSNPDVVGILTGASCSYSRSERTRRATVTAKADDELIAQADRVLLYVSRGIYVKDSPEGEFTLLGPLSKDPTSQSNGTNSVRFDLTFGNTTEVTLRLQFTATPTKYWYLNNIEHEVNGVVKNLTRDPMIFFPFNFSYHCSRNAMFHVNTTYLKFTDLQVQIDPRLSGDTRVFSDGYDCIGFTTIPIWSGIFTTVILALIFIWAINMIMDIRTMDRFDDPKGKTITIAASE